MNKFATLRLFRAFSKVNFYTFVKDGEAVSETEKFFDRFLNDPDVGDELLRLADWITIFGEEFGAWYELFRFENEAQALPPPAKFMKELVVKNLRLYCVWVSKEIVVRANGGIKNSQTVQETSELLPHFRFANEMAKQFREAFRRREIRIIGKQIADFQEIELSY